MIGFGARDDDWNEHDEKCCRGVMFDMAVKDGHFGAPEDWHLYDQFFPLVVEMRVEAKRIARETGKSLKGIWSTLKKRPTQDRSEVIDGAFQMSNHYKRRWRQAWAIADQLAEDQEEKSELAKDIFLQHSDKRTVDAWEAMAIYEQLSLFDDVSDPAEGEKVERYTLLVDETPTGRDPAQLSFLDAVLDEAGLSERIKDVAEHLSDGTHPAEIARILGVSKQTVMRDMRVLKEYGEGWINDVPWPSADIGPDNDPDDEPEDVEGEGNGTETSAA